MKDAAPQTIYLADYTPPAYLVETVTLWFDLHPHKTRVRSRIMFRPNPDSADNEFFLHGEGLKLISAMINGKPVTPTQVAGGLICIVPEDKFVWEAEVEIDPAGNTALEGLYMSNGMYCTQCEAEGFRKITYYPDRPDVMAVFTVHIQSDLPVLLSNGNQVSNGVWHDPWPKPSYLFALVAGDLVAHRGQFTTMEGREVALNIWVRPGDLGKCGFAMSALIAAMRWDEKVYGRAYDLDVFNIVAVDDFNMGAMENKGLNIFNSSCVLASPETATDADFERIEAIIAHEYFHNWTGNRITCRDWFQLCLKEGLTVFRDQQFTGDMRSHGVKRIDDAVVMRTRQFREDAGPLAHPVRPASFVEINNFYTVTVYEKGAEIVRMLRRLVGAEGYRAAVDLYFQRHDGKAATIEDWLTCFTDATGHDLTQFALWYSQAGTPHLTVEESYENGTFRLTFTQHTPATPDQADKRPKVIPIAVGLLAADGSPVLSTRVLEMTQARQSFAFEGLDSRPVSSILRDFSAPVMLRHERTAQEKAFLLAHDPDPFNRWDAGRALAMDTLVAMIRHEALPDRGFLDGLTAVLRDDMLDPAYRARFLALPSQDDIAVALVAAGSVPDPLTIYHAVEALQVRMAQHMQDLLPRIAAEMQVDGPYSPSAADAGRRALGNAVLSLISRLDGGKAAARQYATATNMTQQRAALSILLSIGKGAAEVAAFAAQWQHDRLVMDKWFAVQVGHAAPERAAKVAAGLTEHPDFTLKTPNRFRAVFGALTGNTAGFHHPNAEAYALLAEWLIRLDALNPQTAARISTAFETWPRYAPERQQQMRAALQRIASASGLSRDTGEMVSRMLNVADH